ncbi:MOSC domain-containing protein [Paraburkholderia sp. BL21I4N1]|uniref:MOSC domain-containing protein n=1 Tax=Paraburkholderia sp. BL21I4N1 TaxID=1938801 RepID=UPI000CFB6A99|nr:MOSC domain-containing protein [Paraburkholderia sp. BL21I4N1]PQV43275.1 MOSC domain-containing protein YiiM [Paraburkholderia sp. BL21I4N1]
MTLSSTIESLFAGGTGVLDLEGHRSGIFKRQIHGHARIEVDGLVGDEHADSRVHGGPEKAVHQYAAENYARLADAFAERANALVPGSLGENLSAYGLSECNVHIGDVFAAGTAVLQVSQPRSPCWKINHRFGVDRMSVYVMQTRITGWYYRVISPGVVRAGDQMTLLERQTDQVSIDRFWQVQLAHRPTIEDLTILANVPGLAPDWKRRFSERMRWLSAQSCPPS